VIVYQVRLTTVEDYAARREPHRRAHIERMAGLRAAGVVVGGGPAPDGRSVDIVYRLQRPEQLKAVVEEDPYWTAGAWTGYEARSFREFVEPWEAPPIVLDGSRPATIVEGRVTDADMAQFALIEMRGRRQVAFGGFFPEGESWALARTADAETALGWFRESGFWDGGSLRARPLLWVL
jgi:uncharacterized protein YciI